MIWETWAPESEKVTTVRGLRMSSENGVLVLVGKGLDEEPLQVFFQTQVKKRIDFVCPILSCDFSDSSVGTRRCVHDEHPVEVGFAGFGSHGFGIGAIPGNFGEARSGRGVSQRSHLLVKGLRAKLAPFRK